jgi:hypothetical protein
MRTHPAGARSVRAEPPCCDTCLLMHKQLKSKCQYSSYHNHKGRHESGSGPWVSWSAGDVSNLLQPPTHWHRAMCRSSTQLFHCPSRVRPRSGLGGAQCMGPTQNASTWGEIDGRAREIGTPATASPAHRSRFWVSDTLGHNMRNMLTGSGRGRRSRTRRS